MLFSSGNTNVGRRKRVETLRAPSLLLSALLGACVAPVTVEPLPLAQLGDGGTAASSLGATPNDGGVSQNGGVEPQGPSAACGGCHQQIYKQWSESMHAFALRSPLVVAQTNVDIGHALANEGPEVQHLCTNCHGPVASIASNGATLPFAGGAAANEGVSCIACHGIDSAAIPGGGGLRAAFGTRIQTATMYGPIDSPVSTGAHRSERISLYDHPEQLCGSCHNVNFDRNGDGRIEKGTDLVLQTTFDEYNDYRNAGGILTCMSCHMPQMDGTTRAAEATAGPPRQVHDHSFVGVDVRFGAPDMQTKKREALLQSAAGITLDNANVTAGRALVTISIDNRSGHAFPTGFAFARQAWLEVELLSLSGVALLRSGFLQKPSDDLCERETLQGALRPFTRGCITGEDPQLVSLQLKLVDEVVADGADKLGRPKIAAAPGAREVLEQFVRGGPVARRRGTDGAALTPLDPFERRSFTYETPVGLSFVPGTLRVRARLRFRSLPPYFLRAMSAQASTVSAAPSAPATDLGAYAEQIPIIDIAKLDQIF